jgi:hypothetical protein
MNVTDLKKALLLCRRSGITPFIWGKHGLGKSSGVLQLTEEEGWGMIDMRCSQLEASDLRGLPDREKTEDGKISRTIYLPPADLPDADRCSPACSLYREEKCKHKACIKREEKNAEILAKNPKAKGDPDSGWEPACQGVLFLDELNRAEDDVLQAAFQLVYDRAIGSYFVPEGWSIAVAGNYAEGYTVNSFNDDAFLDRFCHMDLSVDKSYLNDWFSYMSDRWPTQSTKINQFIGFDPANLAGKKEADRGFAVAPSPRAWELVAKVDHEFDRNKYDKGVWMDVVSGIIGSELARQYERFSTKVTPTEVITNGMTGKTGNLVKELNRNQQIGLVWGVASHAKALGGKKEHEKRMENVLNYMQWVAVSCDNDLAVMLGRTLMEPEMKSLAGAVLSNPKLAEMAAKYKKTKGPSWVNMIATRPKLQKLMSNVSFGL